jgi:hypothetical protein
MQVISEAEHVLEYVDCLLEILFFVCARLSNVSQKYTWAK